MFKHCALVFVICKRRKRLTHFLSPDGKLVFFNSDETGILQAYMIRGLG
jgi:hypothetical protein